MGGGGTQSPEGMVILNSRSSWVGGHTRGNGVSRGDTVFVRIRWATFYYGF